MDILDEFPKERKRMEKDKVKGLLDLMRAVQNHTITLEVYWRKMGDLWNEYGFPERAEECYSPLISKPCSSIFLFLV